MTRAQLRRMTRDDARRGAAALEVAILLSALCVPCLMTINLAREFHTAALIDNCARNGALAWADPRIARKLECLNPDTGAVDVEKAALIGAEALDPPPVVTWVTEKNAASGDYIEVTVDYQFDPAVTIPGVPSLSRVVRQAWMRKLPAAVTAPAH